MGNKSAKERLLEKNLNLGEIIEELSCKRLKMKIPNENEVITDTLDGLISENISIDRRGVAQKDGNLISKQKIKDRITREFAKLSTVIVNAKLESEFKTIFITTKLNETFKEITREMKTNLEADLEFMMNFSELIRMKTDKPEEEIELELSEIINFPTTKKFIHNWSQNNDSCFLFIKAEEGISTLIEDSYIEYKYPNSKDAVRIYLFDKIAKQRSHVETTKDLLTFVLSKNVKGVIWPKLEMTLDECFLIRVLLDSSFNVFLPSNVKHLIGYFYYIWIMRKIKKIDSTGREFKIFDYVELQKRISQNCNKKENSLIEEDDPNEVLSNVKGMRNSFHKSFSNEMKRTSDEGILARHYFSKNTFGNDNKMSIYKGEYDKSSFLSNGKGCFAKKDIHNKDISYYYKGTFRMGKKHGIGILYEIEPNLGDLFSYYRGEWRNDRQYGYGLNFYCEDRSKFIVKQGQWVHGEFLKGKLITFEWDKGTNNLKTFTLFDGDYQPNLKNQPNGKFNVKLYNYSQKDHKLLLVNDYNYEGKIYNGREVGFGKVEDYHYDQIEYKSYVGEVKNGKKHGAGKIIYNDNNYIRSYEGIFNEDKEFSHFGRVEFKSGDIYEGFFKNSKKHDIGLYFHVATSGSSEEMFFGQFKNDRKNGIGRSCSTNFKRILVGNYVDGEKNGNFCLVGNTESQKDQGGNENGNLMRISTDKEKMFGQKLIQNKILDRMIYEKNDLAITQDRVYYYFENNDIIEKSNKPIND